jgi:hypothetical protein
MTRLDNMRVRTLRGAEITAKSWLTEAADAHADGQHFDPEVAERPRLTGRLRRPRPAPRATGTAFTTASSPQRCRWLHAPIGYPARAGCRQARAGVVPPRTTTRRACSIANSNLVPQWATLGEFRRARPQRACMMYGQMTAGSWIYIGTQGIRAGHLRDLRRGWRGGTSAATPRGPAGS